MPPAELEPAISTSERPQTQEATGFDRSLYTTRNKIKMQSLFSRSSVGAVWQYGDLWSYRVTFRAKCGENLTELGEMSREGAER